MIPRIGSALPALVAGLALCVATDSRAIVTPYAVDSYGTGILNAPAGIAIAPSGDTYVVSSLGRRVEKFSKYGTHLLGWGSQGSGLGQFDFPYGIAVDELGVYVLDVNAARLQRFSTSGAYLGEFGTPGAGNGQFADPRGVAVDGHGLLYVIDTSNQRVQKFTTSGTYLGQWGSEGTGDGQFEYAAGIAVDAKGDVYVADTYNHRIQKFSAAGTFLRKWGSSGTGDGQFAFPTGINVDVGGNVYITDVNNHRVQRFTPTGVFVSKWGSQGSGLYEFVFPQGVAVDPEGDVHVADTNNNRVVEYRGRDTTGHEALFTIGTFGSGAAEFAWPTGIAAARDGSVYVVDKVGNRAQKFNSFGSWMAQWGGFGFGDGELYMPTGCAVDSNGFVYVAEEGNDRVQKFTSSGVFVTKWGGGAGPFLFDRPRDIAVDAFDNVWVADFDHIAGIKTDGTPFAYFTAPFGEGIGTDLEGNIYQACPSLNTVKKYAPDGTLLLEWGTFGNLNGQFNTPHDVACDANGYVYVCDENDRVQQFTSLGGYVSEWGEPGSARRQLGTPQRMAVDGPGSVYATEEDNNRYQKFASAPEILSIADVPGDNGGSATITFRRSSAEAPNSGAGFTTCRIVRLETSPPIGQIVATIPNDGTTTVVVNTAANTTDIWTGMREFQIQELLGIPNSFPTIGINYGFSTDDLAPPTPNPFTGVYASGATNLHWNASPATDLSQYRLYRGVAADFAIAPGSLIHASPDTGYADVGPAGRYYKLTAADTSGNVSLPAVLGPNQTVDAPGDQAALEFRLDEIRPNPSPGRALVVRFVLPDAAKARLTLINVAGRSLWSHEVSGTGPHTLRVGGEQALPPGIYLVRLARNNQALVRRAVVLD
jgi:DNA-binding beta-propeller fold protein YncE